MNEVIIKLLETAIELLKAQDAPQVPPKVEQVPSKPQSKTDNPNEDSEWKRRFG